MKTAVFMGINSQVRQKCFHIGHIQRSRFFAFGKGLKYTPPGMRDLQGFAGVMSDRDGCLAHRLKPNLRQWCLVFQVCYCDWESLLFWAMIVDSASRGGFETRPCHNLYVGITK